MIKKDLGISQLIDSAWDAFVKNWKYFVPLFLGVLLMNALITYATGRPGAGGVHVTALEIVWSLVQFVIIVGAIHGSLEIARGVQVSYRDFMVYDKVLPAFGTYLIFIVPLAIVFSALVFGLEYISQIDASAIFASGSEYLFIPIIIFVALICVLLFFYAIRMYFYMFIAIDTGHWGKRALVESWNMTKGHTLFLTKLLVAIIVINIIGIFILFAGLIVSLSITFIMTAFAYTYLRDDMYGTSTNLPTVAHLTLPSE